MKEPTAAQSLTEFYREGGFPAAQPGEAISEAMGGKKPPELTKWEFEKVKGRLQSGRWRKHSDKIAVSFLADFSTVVGDVVGKRFQMRTMAQGLANIGLVVWASRERGFVVVLVDVEHTPFVRQELAEADKARASTHPTIVDPPLGVDEEVIEEDCSCEGKDPACRWCVDGKIITRRKKP